MGTNPAIENCCRIIDAGMDAHKAEVLALRFKALSDPTRVRILNLLLLYEELCVCELQLHFELSQPTVSHHLGLLRRAGLVDSDARGRWAFYRVRREAVEELSGVLDMARAAT